MEQAKAIDAPVLPRKADFVRVRELTLAVDLPVGWQKILHASRGTLVITGRNLALWTKFTGSDPEVSNPQPFFGWGGVNVSDRDAAGIPLGRVISFRLDLAWPAGSENSK